MDMQILSFNMYMYYQFMNKKKIIILLRIFKVESNFKVSWFVSFFENWSETLMCVGIWDESALYDILVLSELLGLAAGQYRVSWMVQCVIKFYYGHINVLHLSLRITCVYLPTFIPPVYTFTEWSVKHWLPG